MEVRILDDVGSPSPAGERAGLRHADGQRTFHYHNDEAKTAAAWQDGAFTVGDVGYLDDDGYLYITDRASDMVIRDGVNIYPREVEEALHTHPAVVDCAVFGVPDERDGEHLKAVVEGRPGVHVEELQAHCAPTSPTSSARAMSSSSTSCPVTPTARSSSGCCVRRRSAPPG